MSGELIVKRGDTWVWTFVYRDSTGTPMDLSGSSVRMHARSAKGTLVIQVSDGSGIVLDPLEGEATVRIEPVETQLIGPGKYDADIEVTWSDGTVQSSATFIIQVLADITI